MTNVINTNVSSLVAQASLSRTGRGLDRSLERLASGLRINSARDDAAGLAIANRLSAQIGGLRQAVRNANDGISLAQTAEGALQETTNILLRIRDLSVQAINDTNDATDRVNIQKEVTQLKSELNRIADTTKFSGKHLLDGSFTSQSFQVGAFSGETISFSIKNVRSDSIGNNTVTASATIDDAVSETTTNNVAAQVLTISGNSGSDTASVLLADDAKAIATAVNAKSAKTGVTATAKTTVTLDTLTLAGTITMTLGGDATAAISGSVSDTNDLSNLMTSINGNTATTGITAEFGSSGSDKSSLVLTHSTGADITIASFAGSGGATSMDMTGGSGSAITLNDADATSGSGVAGGQVSFKSIDAFTVVTDTTGTVFSSATNASSLSAVSSIDLSSASGADSALDVIDTALGSIDDVRASLGAIQNRLVNTINNLTNVSNNQESARSRIIDADFASETAALTKFQILQQAGISILAQANARPQSVLSLLQ